jgi:hypothetical protein
MISTRKDTGVVDPVLLEKMMVSGRIPLYVKKYAELNKLSISELVMAGFDSYREKDVEHAIERLSYHEKRVLHWKQVVLQNEELSNTELVFCNTVRDEFRRQERGHRENRRQDEEWLLTRVKKGQAEGYKITLNKLYNFCISDNGDGNGKS